MVRHGRDECFQECLGCLDVGTFVQLSEGEFRGAIDSDKEMKLAFRASDFSDVDMEITNSVGLELFLFGLVSCQFRQAADAVTFETAMQGRARQLRDRGLQRIEAVIEWQERVAPKSYNDGFFFSTQNGRVRLLGSGLQILDRSSVTPFTSGFRVDAVSRAQRRERSLRSLYRCSDGVRGRGATVTYLAHCSSFQARGSVMPSNAGTVQLVDAKIYEMRRKQAIAAENSPNKPKKSPTAAE